jgi:hypothetical protein
MSSVLLVFGRGSFPAGDGYRLSAASSARVDAAVAHVLRHGGGPRVIFSGGWAEASRGDPPPPPGRREGDLMLRRARAAGLERHAELYAETRSRSTLENLLNTADEGLLDGFTFDAGNPLGLVAHAGHLRRVRYLAGKALGLSGRALLDVPAVGGDSGDRRELIAARIGFLGARTAAQLLRRERRMAGALRLAEGVIRSARGRPG